jgi:molybdopterin-guanine dinucleotide biosynthesis protein MobB
MRVFSKRCDLPARNYRTACRLRIFAVLIYPLDAMKRLHIIGRKNHGKTTLVVDLVKEFANRGISVGTVKHTHHRHELDVPGKDSYRHRMAGATAVGILSPSMSAIFLPIDDGANGDRYTVFEQMFTQCQFILVEGDSTSPALKLEVWRRELGTPPMIRTDKSIRAIVTDDTLPDPAEILRRTDVAKLADWILRQLHNNAEMHEPQISSSLFNVEKFRISSRSMAT